MDREAAVLRAEMSQTRADLDEKLTRLQARVEELKPRKLTERYIPDHFADRALGVMLTIVGLRMLWSQYTHHDRRRKRLRTKVIAYGSW